METNVADKEGWPDSVAYTICAFSFQRNESIQLNTKKKILEEYPPQYMPEHEANWEHSQWTWVEMKNNFNLLDVKIKSVLSGFKDEIIQYSYSQYVNNSFSN